MKKNFFLAAVLLTGFTLAAQTTVVVGQPGVVATPCVTGVPCSSVAVVPAPAVVQTVTVTPAPVVYPAVPVIVPVRRRYYYPYRHYIRRARCNRYWRHGPPPPPPPPPCPYW